MIVVVDSILPIGGGRRRMQTLTGADLSWFLVMVLGLTLQNNQGSPAKYAFIAPSGLVYRGSSITWYMGQK